MASIKVVGKSAALRAALDSTLSPTEDPSGGHCVHVSLGDECLLGTLGADLDLEVTLFGKLSLARVPGCHASGRIGEAPIDVGRDVILIQIRLDHPVNVPTIVGPIPEMHDGLFAGP